jgi:hypothetical protein
LIQRHLSRRLSSLDAIATLRGRDAVGVVSDGERCVGVQILPRAHSAAARSIPADLVVDAMGAGSRLCVWLDDIWRIRVPSEREQITAHYASRMYRLPGSPPDVVVIDHRRAHPHRAATSGWIRRRRFDRAPYLPAGVVALGGSVCSFDPLYGQDFELAVLEAAALGRILSDQRRYADGSHLIELQRRYFRAVTLILDLTRVTGASPALRAIR